MQGCDTEETLIGVFQTLFLRQQCSLKNEAGQASQHFVRMIVYKKSLFDHMMLVFSELKEMISNLSSYDFYKTYYGRDKTGHKDPNWDGPPAGFCADFSDDDLDGTTAVQAVSDISTLACKLPIKRFCERLMTGYYDSCMIRMIKDNPKSVNRFSLDLVGKDSAVIKEFKRLLFLYNEDFKAKVIDDPVKNSPVHSPTFLLNAQAAMIVDGIMHNRRPRCTVFRQHISGSGAIMLS